MFIMKKFPYLSFLFFFFIFLLWEMYTIRVGSSTNFVLEFLISLKSLQSKKWHIRITLWICKCSEGLVWLLKGHWEHFELLSDFIHCFSFLYLAVIFKTQKFYQQFWGTWVLKQQTVFHILRARKNQAFFLMMVAHSEEILTWVIFLEDNGLIF